MSDQTDGGIGPSPCAYCKSRDHIESGCPVRSASIHTRLDVEVARLRADQADGVTRVSDSYINGVEHAANIAYRMEPQIHTVTLVGAACARCKAPFELGEKVVYVETEPMHHEACPVAEKPTLLSELADEPESTRALVIHGQRVADADGFYPDAPTRRQIALALLKQVEPLEGRCSGDDKVRVETLQMALGWVMGWSDLELPEMPFEDEGGER